MKRCKVGAGPLGDAPGLYMPCRRDGGTLIPNRGRRTSPGPCEAGGQGRQRDGATGLGAPLTGPTCTTSSVLN